MAHHGSPLVALLLLAPTSGCGGPCDPCAVDADVEVGIDAQLAGDASIGDASIDAASIDASTPPRDVPFADGARLTAVVWDGGDGALELAAWHDDVLGSECAFTPLADGQVACAARIELVYADATCTRVVARVPAGAPPPPSLFVAADPAADPVATLPSPWTVGDELATPSFYARSAGSCIALGNPDASRGFDASPASASGLVRASLVRSRRGGLEVRAWVGDDGTYEAFALDDAVRGFPCDVLSELGTTGERRCRPWAPHVLSAGTYFADASCTDASIVGVVLWQHASQPHFFTEHVGAACGSTTAVVDDLGPAVPSAFTLVDGTCTPFAPASVVLLSRRGVVADADLETLQAAARGTGRLTTIEFAAADGSDPVGITSSGSAARFRDARGGRVCLVTGDLCTDELFTTLIDGRFADAACTMPLAHALAGVCAQPRYARSGDTLYPVVGDFTGAMVYAGDPTNCLPIASLDAAVVLGPPEPITDVFAPVTRHLDR